MGISYSGRTNLEGKKINWRDGGESDLRHTEIQPQTALEVSELSYTRPNILAGFGDCGAKYNAFLLDLILWSAHGRYRTLDFTKLSERIVRL